jgi:hypothetical protein
MSNKVVKLWHVPSAPLLCKQPNLHLYLYLAIYIIHNIVYLARHSVHMERGDI